MRLLLVVTFFILIGLKGFSQPIETIYPGTLVQSGYTNDESYGPFNIGFDFSFFENVYTQFYLNTNGQILFDGASIDGENVAIHNASLPNNFIAGFWDDLAVSFTGKILYSTIGAAPNRKLIIQFVNMNFYNIPSSFGTYLVILYENTNKIQVQYRLILDYLSTRAHGGTATIGLENATGSDGKQHSYNNSSAITNEQAISFSPSGSTYTINSDAIYDGVYLTTNITLPDPGITILTIPAQDAIIGSAQTFEWNAASNAASYTLYISSRSDLADATVYYPGSNLSYSVTGLTLDATYYWGVFATNATGTTWCEIKKFTTTTVPPLAAIPQTIWVEQNQEKTIKLNYTGGDASPKTAIITSLPSQGKLYQYNAGVKGSEITSLPFTIPMEEGRNVIYAATGSAGNGVGNFNFKIYDDPIESSVEMVTINVSPPGVPNVLYFARGNNLEIQFDIPMTNPSGNEGQFLVTVNTFPVNVSLASLKTGDPYTIQLTLVTPLIGTDNVLISYTPGSVTGSTGGLLLPFTNEPVTLTAQIINFSQSLGRKYNESPFVLSASASSGLGMTFSSSNLAVATISSNVATFHSLGTSEITARQAGNTTYAPAKYIKTLTVAKGDQTITFNSLPAKTVGDDDFSPGAIASSGLTVSYSSDNALVATIVSGWIHITGAGTAVITASQTGNSYYNAATSVPQTLTVTAASKTLNLTILLEGLYNGASGMVKVQTSDDGETSYDVFSGTITDTLTVKLAQVTDPYSVVYSAYGVPVNTDGTIYVGTIPGTLSGDYYIIINHRNHVETWSQIVSFSDAIINYNFTDAISKAWGNNMILFGGYYCIYTGDVNNDEYVDGFDIVKVFNLNKTGSFGYQLSDINGDGFIDGFDLVKVFNNNKKGVGMNTPLAPM